MPHRVGHQFIQHGGENTTVDDIGPALELFGQSQLGFRGHLGFQVTHLDFKALGVIFAADETVIVGNGAGIGALDEFCSLEFIFRYNF